MTAGKLLMGGKSTPPQPWDITRLVETGGVYFGFAYARASGNATFYSPTGDMIYQRSGSTLRYNQLAAPFDCASVGTDLLTVNSIDLYSLASQGGAADPTYLFAAGGACWFNNGSSLLVVGPYYSSGWRLFEYAASVPYDPTTLTFVKQVSPTVPTQSATTYFYWLDAAFSPDGLTLFVFNPYGAAEFWIYPLGTAFDIGTLGTPSYFDASGVIPNYLYPYTFEFKPDGTALCIRNTVYPLSTPWDVSTIGAGSSYSTGVTGEDAVLVPHANRALVSTINASTSQNALMKGYVFTDVWTLAGATQEWVVDYGLFSNIAYYPEWGDVDTDRVLCLQYANYYGKYVQGLDAGNPVESPAGRVAIGGYLAMSTDGLKAISISGNQLYQYTLAAPWDFNGAVLQNQVTLTGSYNRTFCYVNPAGTVAIVGYYDSGTAQNWVQLLRFTTPWDITTVVENTSNRFYLSVPPYYALITPAEDYVIVSTNNNLQRFPVPTPGDLSTVTGYDQSSPTFSTLTGSKIITSSGVFASSDGLRFFAIGYGKGYISKLEVR